MAALTAAHDVMIWTSAQPETVQAIVGSLFDRATRNALVAVWDRTKLGLTKQQYVNKVQVYKVLDRVWESETIGEEAAVAAAGGKKKKKKFAALREERRRKREAKEAAAHQERSAVQTPDGHEVCLTPEAPLTPPRVKNPYDQTNTILIDDSKLKASSHPHNVIEVPEFTADVSSIDDNATLPLVLRKLGILSRYEDVSTKLRQWAEKEGAWVRQHERAPGSGLSPLLMKTYWKTVLDEEDEFLRKNGGLKLR